MEKRSRQMRTKMQQKLLTNTVFPVSLVTIFTLALERALSVLASGLWRAVVLVFAALIHVFWESDKSCLRYGKNVFTVGWIPSRFLSILLTCIVNSPRPLSIVWSLGYSHLSHNRCLWIPVGIHTCSLSERSHSGKRQSGGRCSFCKRSVRNSNEKCLSVFFSPYSYIFYIFFPQMRAIVYRLIVGNTSCV